jgi:hypothetical protein
LTAIEPANLLIFPEGSDWSVTNLALIASTTTTQAPLTPAPAVEYTTSDLQTALNLIGAGYTVSYVIGIYNGNDYNSISVSGTTYGMIGLHIECSNVPTGVATYAPNGSTGSPALQQAYYLTRTTGPTYKLYPVAAQSQPQTESIRFMVPCGSALAAAGGFDYKNAEETVETQTIIASCSVSTLHVTTCTNHCLNIGTAISDTAGYIPAGCTIIGFGSGSGGLGTYTVSPEPGTVPSENMKAITAGPSTSGGAGVDGFGWLAFDTATNVAQGD